jgi:hypothetical protein
MKEECENGYEKPRVERFGTMRNLTRVGCTLGGDGVWICRTAPPDIGIPGDGDDRS